MNTHVCIQKASDALSFIYQSWRSAYDGLWFFVMAFLVAILLLYSTGLGLFFVIWIAVCPLLVNTLDPIGKTCIALYDAVVDAVKYTYTLWKEVFSDASPAVCMVYLGFLAVIGLIGFGIYGVAGAILFTLVIIAGLPLTVYNITTT